MTSRGILESQTPFLLSLIASTTLISTLLSGVVMTRLSVRLISIIMTALIAISVVLVLVTQSLAMAVVYALLHGLINGFMAVIGVGVAFVCPRPHAPPAVKNPYEP